MRYRKKRMRQQLQKSLRDAAAGIKRDEDVRQPPPPASRTRSNKQRMAPAIASAAPQATRNDSPDDQDVNPENAKLDPRYTGHCDLTTEDPVCFNPDIVKDMEFEDRATWLGKWFAHHYAAWVSDFSMKELENYQAGRWEVEQAPAVDPVQMLCYTFRRFQVPEDEWRSPLFCSPFRLGLRRFRYEIVSTLRTHAIRIFGITDITTIDDRSISAEVAALHPNNNFLYAQGSSRPMARYLRSDCILKALRVVLLGPAALEGRERYKSVHVRAILFGVATVRDTLIAFVATVLWFLLVDGGAFQGKGAKNDCMLYYRERMKSLADMAHDLPEIYGSCKELINTSLFGEEGDEMMGPDSDEQKEFTKKFYADLEEEKSRRKGKAVAKENGSPGSSTGGSEEE